jgi:hypothetical protein
MDVPVQGVVNAYIAKIIFLQTIILEIIDKYNNKLFFLFQLLAGSGGFTVDFSYNSSFIARP